MSMFTTKSCKIERNCSSEISRCFRRKFRATRFGSTQVSNGSLNRRRVFQNPRCCKFWLRRSSASACVCISTVSTETAKFWKWWSPTDKTCSATVQTSFTRALKRSSIDAKPWNITKGLSGLNKLNRELKNLQVRARCWVWVNQWQWGSKKLRKQ